MERLLRPLQPGRKQRLPRTPQNRKLKRPIQRRNHLQRSEKIEPDLSERKLKKHDIDYIILLHVLEGQGIICL